ncbi:MAG: metalloregulator ArsR/SmtB family transcription factor [Syntrophales bacterium]|nr:metalloregulator ArsR/SmtB family transcription factor [Syntrophales bacterium]
MDYEKVSDFFKTLGNPTRLRIVRELTQGELCVGAVENRVQASQANISQHLTILKKQGIVACRKEKNMRCYYLKRPEFIHSVLALIEEEQRHGAE